MLVRAPQSVCESVSQAPHTNTLRLSTCAATENKGAVHSHRSLGHRAATSVALLRAPAVFSFVLMLDARASSPFAGLLHLVSSISTTAYGRHVGTMTTPSRRTSGPWNSTHHDRTHQIGHALQCGRIAGSQKCPQVNAKRACA